MDVVLPLGINMLTGEDAATWRTRAEAATIDRDTTFKVYNGLLDQCGKFGVNPNPSPELTILPYNIANLYTSLMTLGEISSFDAIYNGVDLNNLEKFLAWDWTHKLTYKLDYFDCDNFSAQLANHASILGFTIGIITNTIHSWNIFVDVHTFEVHHIEPQIGAIVNPETDSMYRVDQFTKIRLGN